MGDDRGFHGRDMNGNSQAGTQSSVANSSRGPRRPAVVFVCLALILLLALAGGLGAFAVKIAHDEPQAAPQADGIVVLTGGAARISEALKLLGNGSAKRLLITGVNVATSREALRSELDASKQLFDCCVDLGRQAVNTEGNAAEAAAWVRNQHFTSVILVTSNYHMPRSLIEFQRYLPEARVIAYPVKAGSPVTGSAVEMLTNSVALRVVATEYAKYLVALARKIAWDSWRAPVAPAQS